MQASRNMSDAWLAHWISNINQSSVIQPIQPNVSLQFEPSSHSSYIFDQAMCFLKKIIVFRNLTECLNDNKNEINITELTQTPTQTQESLDAENSYYLAVYIAIAIFNSLIALVRAFAFAYAGIKAAKFIHNRLLFSVIYVSNLRLTQCFSSWYISIFIWFILSFSTDRIQFLRLHSCRKNSESFFIRYEYHWRFAAVHF